MRHYRAVLLEGKTIPLPLYLIRVSWVLLFPLLKAVAFAIVHVVFLKIALRLDCSSTPRLWYLIVSGACWSAPPGFPGVAPFLHPPCLHISYALLSVWRFEL